MIYVIKYGKIYKDIGRTRSSAEILRKIKFNKYRKFSISIPIPKPLPHGEGLCMLCWLCICAIVVVCCRCVLHRLCSTTCMRPCIKPLGVLSRHPCRIPKPLSPVKGCVCFVGFASLQSPLAYTPGIRAGAECGAAALTPLGATPKARTLWLLAKSYKQGRLCQLNQAVARCNGTNS